jgi:hypothetical protein
MLPLKTEAKMKTKQEEKDLKYITIHHWLKETHVSKHI